MNLLLCLERGGLKEWMGGLPLVQQNGNFIKDWMPVEVLPKVVARMHLAFEQVDLQAHSKDSQALFASDPVLARQSIEFY